MATTKKPKQTVNVIRRKEAGRFIDAVLLAASEYFHKAEAGQDPDGERAIKDILTAINKAHLALPKPCTGEAHSNPHIDGCGACKNYIAWGWNGTETKVT